MLDINKKARCHKNNMFKNCSFLLDLTEISSKIHGKDNAEISEVLFKPQDHQEIVIFAK